MLAPALIQRASELCPTHIERREQAFDDLPARMALSAFYGTDVGAVDARKVSKTILG